MRVRAPVLVPVREVEEPGVPEKIFTRQCGNGKGRTEIFQERSRNSMEGRNFEEIFQKYDFWEKLTQEQKQFLKERVKWNQYQEGQFVTGTGSK